MTGMFVMPGVFVSIRLAGWRKGLHRVMGLVMTVRLVHVPPMA
jgi:hypothetical protein